MNVILRVFILGIYLFFKVKGFLFEVSTLPPGTCDAERFQVCLKHTDLFYNNYTTNGAHIDGETLYSFFCGENFTQMVQCFKDHADPRCAPHTETATILNAVSNITDATRNSLCRNKTSYTDYMNCQSVLPNLKPFQDCITGTTLNTTFDVEETCNFFLMTLGCAFKYIDMMCPSSLNYFIESGANVANCHLDFPSSATAQSCDLNMELGCDVAFGKPNISDTQAMFQFYCSDRFPGYKECIRKVAKLCKSVDFTTLQTQTSENQLAVMCNNKTGYEEFQTCFLKYGKNTEFISCLTGNGTLQDSCSLLKASYTCNKDFIQRACPAVLPIYQTISFYDDRNCHVGFMPILTSAGARSDMGWTFNIYTFTMLAAFYATF